MQFQKSAPPSSAKNIPLIPANQHEYNIAENKTTKSN